MTKSIGALDRTFAFCVTILMVASTPQIVAALQSDPWDKSSGGFGGMASIIAPQGPIGESYGHSYGLGLEAGVNFGSHFILGVDHSWAQFVSSRQSDPDATLSSAHFSLKLPIGTSDFSFFPLLEYGKSAWSPTGGAESSKWGWGGGAGVMLGAGTGMTLHLAALEDRSGPFKTRVYTLGLRVGIEALADMLGATGGGGSTTTPPGPDPIQAALDTQLTAIRAAGNQPHPATQSAQAPRAAWNPTIRVVIKHNSVMAPGLARVVSSPPGIDCPGTCSANFGQSTRVTLTATADATSAIESFYCQAVAGQFGEPQPGNTESCLWDMAYFGGGGTAELTVNRVPTRIAVAGNGSQERGNGGSASSGGVGAEGSSGATSFGGSSGGNPSRFVTPLSVSCVRAFYDPQMYNWLAFENTCTVSMHLTFIFATEQSGSAMDLGPGRHDSTGDSAGDVRGRLGDAYKVFPCPAGSYAVNPGGRSGVTYSSTTYQCQRL